MTALGWIAAVVLFLQLPIPLYWFVVHPQVNFWRQHQKASYIVGLLCSWLPVTVCLVLFWRVLFRADWPAAWAAVLGFVLIGFEGWLFWRLTADLGAARLVGKTELSGAGSLASHGVYAYIRHPRYLGSMLAILGACLLAGRGAMWIAAACWAVLMLVAIGLEERELRSRFGADYEQYARRVPRFVPRFIPRLQRAGKADGPGA